MKYVIARFMAVLLVTACYFSFTTCRKEYSYEGGPKKDTATYTLVNLAGTCTGSVLSGKFYTGTALTSANTVQLQVNVSSVGVYTISTNTANGFHFYGAGQFTQTGNQTVVLTATGTPVSAAVFFFTATGGGGCSFSVTVTAPQVVMASFALAGAPNNCMPIETDGSYYAGTVLSAGNYVVVTVNITSLGAYTLTTDTLDGIFFSASGVFTAKGTATVKLMGKGTPAFARNLLFTPHSDSSACSFPLTISNPDPVATYVLESGFGTPNPCIFTVAGNYVAGTALTAANTITLSVYVTAVGNFTIATNAVNGMQFAYSGSFSTTGQQKVTLTGTGTPLVKGLFSFTPQIVGPHPLGGEVCAADLQVQ